MIFGFRFLFKVVSVVTQANWNLQAFNTSTSFMKILMFKHLISFFLKSWNELLMLHDEKINVRLLWDSLEKSKNYFIKYWSVITKSEVNEMLESDKQSDDITHIFYLNMFSSQFLTQNIFSVKHLINFIAS